MAPGFFNVGVTAAEGRVGDVCDERGQRKSRSFDKSGRKGF